MSRTNVRRVIEALRENTSYLVDEVVRLQEEVDRLRGSTNNAKKLSPREVERIRNQARSGRFSQRQIADMYGVNPGTVSRIVRGIYHGG